MSIRRTLFVAVGIAALGAASTAFAGITGKRVDELRNRSEEQPQSEPAAQAPAPQRGSNSRQSRPVPAPVQAPAPTSAPAPRERGVPASSPRLPAAESGDSARGRNRGVNGELLSRAVRERDSARGQKSGDGHGRPPQIVPSLPASHHHYDWDGRRYYRSGRDWYQPYGSSYIAIGVPYGLFVASLPGYSSSFWYGGTRYFYSDDTYFTYEPVRRGYVVSQSPYREESDQGDDYYYDADTASRDDDLYIYPASGQSEQKQADDRYECHRWAVHETGYDPIDAEYVRTDRANYLRALTACLTGRGYSVR